MAEQLMSELWVDEKLMAVFAKVRMCFQCVSSILPVIV